MVREGRAQEQLELQLDIQELSRYDDIMALVLTQASHGERITVVSNPPSGGRRSIEGQDAHASVGGY